MKVGRPRKPEPLRGGELIQDNKVAGRLSRYYCRRYRISQTAIATIFNYDDLFAFDKHSKPKLQFHRHLCKTFCKLNSCEPCTRYTNSGRIDNSRLAIQCRVYEPCTTRYSRHEFTTLISEIHIALCTKGPTVL
ncbi:hypothetical protein EVAR_41606_1 [Eumeta japonica]|uniref:Uncharacterized protein n=1 Tax=Eumeta variegata TaxID=151549 RepID=A0A4C1ZYD8_EUMVA|nr:hypothetical protein EVAR_41606_1 [Eumeta japonica]